jgi:hypothetical protein
MNGYQYLIERNRLLCGLEDALAEIRHLPQAERGAKTAKLQAEFDRQLAELYSQVAAEYPGERKKQPRRTDEPS